MTGSEPDQERGVLGLTLVATELGAIFAGAILPTPLYPLYRQAFGFSAFTLTLIYAVYVLGNLLALLLFGRLSDQIGRRTVGWPAIACALASAGIFAAAFSTGWLFAARALSGFATGLASGTATAWIAELFRSRDTGAAARLAAAANFFGCAGGPLLGGLLAQFAPAPLQVPFVAYSLPLCALAAALPFARETVTDRAHNFNELSLRPRLGVPQKICLQFLAPAATGFAVFALIGFYSALIPGLLRENLHLSAPAIAGAVVFELFLIAAVAILTSPQLTSQMAMLSALAVLPPSLWLLVGAELAQSLSLLLAAAAAGGVAGGLGYRGSLEVINRIAPTDRRSEVVSRYMVVLFAGNSVPVIGIGLLTAMSGALSAHVTFAVVITLIAGVAMVTGIKYTDR